MFFRLNPRRQKAKGSQVLKEAQEESPKHEAITPETKKSGNRAYNKAYHRQNALDSSKGFAPEELKARARQAGQTAVSQCQQTSK